MVCSSFIIPLLPPTAPSPFLSGNNYTDICAYDVFFFFFFCLIPTSMSPNPYQSPPLTTVSPFSVTIGLFYLF